MPPLSSDTFAAAVDHTLLDAASTAARELTVDAVA
jgi:hypothetical protein